MAALQETGRKALSELLKGTTRFQSESGVNFYFATVDVKGSTTIDPIGTILLWDGVDAFGVFAAPVDWAGTTANSVGDVVKPTTRNGFEYIAVAAGTTGGSEPTFPVILGDTVVDGTVTWKAQAPYGVDVTSSLPNKSSLALSVGAKEGIGFNKEAITLTGTATQMTVLFRGDAQVVAAGMELTGLTAADILEMNVALEKQLISIGVSAEDVVPSFVS